jgi:hypothetical protein
MPTQGINKTIVFIPCSGQEDTPVAIKKASDYTFVKRRNGRFAVRKRGGGLVHGEEKTKALQAAGKVKVLKSKPKAEAETPA